MKKIEHILLLGFTLFCVSVFAQRNAGQLQVLEWEQLVGLELDERNGLLKNTEGEFWGKSGAFSKQFLKANRDGHLEFNIQDENIFFALGMSYQNTDNHFKSMDHAFFFERGSFFIVDKGRVIGEFGNYRRGDHFKIRRINGGTDMSYLYNNIEVYQASTANTGQIYADLSLFSEFAYIDVMQVDLSWEVEIDVTPTPFCFNDNSLNWIEKKTYDLDGNPTSHSKVFSDKYGKTLQSQAKNMETGQVFASQPVYDALGRPVLQTLSAPINSTALCYTDNFIENENGDTYDYTDFDLENTSSSTNTGQINNPKRVKDSDQGTLGWYYSNNNTDEAYVANTNYPYSRVEYSKSNPGQVRRASQAGDVLRMGKGHETEQYSMAASTELYYVYGYAMDWNTGGAFGSQLQPINMDYQVIKSITVDADEKEYVSFTDHDGKTLATCRSGLSSPLQTVESVLEENGYIDIHLPKYCESSLVIHYPSGANNTNIQLKITDLSTDKYITNGGSTIFGINDQPNLTPGFYRIEHVSGGELPQGLSVTYQLNYERFTVHYYDHGKRLIETVPPLGIDHSYQPGAQLNVWPGSVTSCTSVTQNSLTTNQPANLLVQTGQSNPPQQVAHLSLWGVKLLDPSDAIPVDPVSALVTNNQLSSSLRVANLSTDRANLKRNNHFITGGINGKGLLAFTTKTKEITVGFNNQFFNTALTSSIQSFNPIPLDPSVADPVVGLTPITEQTYQDFDIHYKLGYRKTNGTFVTVKDNLIIHIRKHTQHNVPGIPTPVGNTNRFVTYGGGDNSVVLTEFEDLEKYEVKIDHIDKEEKAYMTAGPFAGQYVTSSSQITDLSTISDLQYFGLRFHVENISGSKAPNHTMSETYKYNSLNWLLEAQSPDEGTSKFVYRNDGQIRFSQNARQLAQGRFSYTNYDKFARPIESGEHKGQIGGYIFTDHYGNGGSGSVSTDAIREVTGGFASDGDNCSACIDRSYIYYDLARTDVPVISGHPSNKQTFVNGSISKTANAHTATWYSYDHYGRITWMIKGYDLNISGTTPTYKLWEYDYDSKGNVSQVTYQPYSNDYFAHIYEYDAANRLDRVYTSISDDLSQKIKQAEYIYYAHGPLKRVELANNLQGIDYVYTINGALKSINNPNPGYDPGRDGIGGSLFDKDQFAMTLDYFGGDYSRSGSGISNVKDDLWNPTDTLYPIKANYSGSITTQHWNRREGGTIAMDQHQNTYIYKYDAFNQLNNAVYGSFKPKTPGTLENNTLSLSNNFKVSNITYDANGNIETLTRRGDTGTEVDVLGYSYPNGTNQLDHVTDIGTENQLSGNYKYDDSGRLIEDVQGNVKYEYSTQGLVTNIYELTSNKRIIRFTYDDGGFRYKKEHFSLSTGLVEKTTLYVRDAFGQVVSVYDLKSSGYKQEEIPFYGASRIGSLYKNTTLVSDDAYYYELKDHLGNVRQTIKEVNGTKTWANHKSDYYPFGMKFMNSSSIGSAYRYGYQGEYAEDETEEDGIKSNSFQLRLYNPRIGRWMSPDPYNQFYSPYLAMGNSPTNQVDPDGGYSKFGSWWRGILRGEKALHDEKYDQYYFRTSEAHNVGTDDFYISVGRDYGKGNSPLELRKAAAISTWESEQFWGQLGYNYSVYGSVEERNAAGAEAPIWTLGKISSDVILPNMLGSGLNIFSKADEVVNVIDDVPINMIDDFKSIYSKPVPYYLLTKVHRAPAGGITIGNKFYKGGQFLPWPRLHFGKGGTGNFKSLTPGTLGSRPPITNYNFSAPVRWGTAIGGSGLIMLNTHRALTQ